VLLASRHSVRAGTEENFTEGNEGNKGWSWNLQPFVIFASFC